MDSTERQGDSHLQLALTAARMVAWEWDPRADVITTSENLADIYGVARLDAAPQGFSLVHPDDLARHEATVRAAVETGRSYHSTFRITRPDTGELVWLEERGVPVLDERGAVEKLIGVTIDVSARARIEAETRQQVALLTLAHDAIIVRAPDGRIISWNDGAAALYGWTAAEALGQVTHALLQTRVQDAGGTGAETDAALAAQGAWEGKLEHRRRDGRWMVVESRQALLRAADGRPEAILEVNRDITALRELEQAREQFLSSAAHDLKNPLTSIRAQVQLAQRRLGRLDGPVVAQTLNLLTGALQGTDTMMDLINELLDVVRMDMGAALELQREATDLVALVANCLVAQRHASGRPIHLQTEAPELRASVDVARIERVVGNLLSNALKYSPEDSAIWVRLTREEATSGPEAVIAVHDEGTGIGLASARGIVEQHGGTIAAESTEGVGSTFTVRLPLEAGEMTRVRAP